MVEILAEAHHLAVDDYTVWLQANRVFGNMVPDLSADWQENYDRAVTMLGAYTTASQVVRMKPKGVSGYLDLDIAGPAPLYHTDGFITTNPDVILHANPADCGEIALQGFSLTKEKPVIGLLHASRGIVDERGHLEAIDYLLDTHEITPETLTARLSPSARGESYKLDYLSEAMKTSPLWHDYVYEDQDGLWHVDFHRRTVDDLLGIGIPKENIAISDGDTIADPAYFSHQRERLSAEQPGANGLFFALR